MPNCAGLTLYRCGNHMAVGDIIERYSHYHELVIAFEYHSGWPIFHSGIMKEKRLWFAPWIKVKTYNSDFYTINPRHCKLIRRHGEPIEVSDVS